MSGLAFIPELNPKKRVNALILLNIRRKSKVNILKIHWTHADTASEMNLASQTVDTRL